MSTFFPLLVTAWRRSTRLAAGGLLAVPLLMHRASRRASRRCRRRCRGSIEEREIGISVEGRPIIAYPAR